MSSPEFPFLISNVTESIKSVQPTSLSSDILISAVSAGNSQYIFCSLKASVSLPLIFSSPSSVITRDFHSDFSSVLYSAFKSLETLTKPLYTCKDISALLNVSPFFAVYVTELSSVTFFLPITLKPVSAWLANISQFSVWAETLLQSVMSSCNCALFSADKGNTHTPSVNVRHIRIANSFDAVFIFNPPR